MYVSAGNVQETFGGKKLSWVQVFRYQKEFNEFICEHEKCPNEAISKCVSCH